MKSILINLLVKSSHKEREALIKARRSRVDKLPHSVSTNKSRCL